MLDDLVYKYSPNEARVAVAERASELIRRGMTDKDCAVRFAAEEYREGIRSPKTLRVELYDKVNYMCRCYMDRIARFTLTYDFVPNIEGLKTAIIGLFEMAPITHSRLVDNHIAPYWSVCDYNIDDVLTVEHTDDLYQASIAFLEKQIPVTENVQFKIGLFISGEKSTLAFRYNHMLMDGGGLKQLISDLAANYNAYMETGAVPRRYRTGRRDYKAVYADMPEEKRKKAQAQFAGLPIKEKKVLPFTKKHPEDRNIIISKHISAEVWSKALALGKSVGATANDVVVAAYIRGVHRLCDLPKDTRVGISCAVDLRRYMADPTQIGYTNHTTFMPAYADGIGESLGDTIRKVSESTKSAKADEFMGLHGLPLLDIGFNSAVYIQAENIVKLFYSNANLAVSNVGKIDGKAYAFGGHEPIDALVAGGAKVKPCAATNALTVCGNLVLTMTIQGNDTDRKIVEDFFGYIEETLINA